MSDLRCGNGPSLQPDHHKVIRGDLAGHPSQCRIGTLRMPDRATLRLVRRLVRLPGLALIGWVALVDNAGVTAIDDW